MERSPPSPAAAVLRLVNGYQLSRAIQTAVVLGVFDGLAAGARSSVALAAELQAHPGALHRLLRALAGAELLTEEDDGRFSLTPTGECLRTDAAHGLSTWVRATGDASYWRAWEALPHSVRTGEAAFPHAHGQDAWAYREAHPQVADDFNRAMSAMARQAARAVAYTYDFSPYPLVIDVGGGEGAMLAAILTRHRAARGVLLDLPQVVATAARSALAPVLHRCEILGGSFFDGVPPDGDLYILSSVLHNWEDAPALAILQACRRAMRPTARLLVIEAEIGRAADAPDRNLIDLNMLVIHGARERSRSEFEALFAAAGLVFLQATPTLGGRSILEVGLA